SSAEVNEVGGAGGDIRRPPSLTANNSSITCSTIPAGYDSPAGNRAPLRKVLEKICREYCSREGALPPPLGGLPPDQVYRLVMGQGQQPVAHAAAGGLRLPLSAIA